MCTAREIHAPQHSVNGAAAQWARLGAAHQWLSRLRWRADPVPVPLPLPLPMPFDHERLEVYQVALDFFDLADEIVEQLPRGRGHLADQLSRASLSIVNNIAEVAGSGFTKGRTA